MQIAINRNHINWQVQINLPFATGIATLTTWKIIKFCTQCFCLKQVNGFYLTEIIYQNDLLLQFSIKTDINALLYNHNNNYTLKMIWQMDKGMPKLYNANILQITGRLFINSAFILVAKDTIQFINTDKILKFAIILNIIKGLQ